MKSKKSLKEIVKEESIQDQPQKKFPIKNACCWLFIGFSSLKCKFL